VSSRGDGLGAAPEWAQTREGALVRTVFDGLDRVGVRWALLRGRAELGAPGGDVDLLVGACDLDSFEDVVFELGAFVLPRVRVPGSWSRAVLRHPWHRFYVLSDRASGATVKLDVVTQLVYSRQQQLVSHLERGCLDRRVGDEGVQVLEPSDAFWTLLLHCLLDKRNVTPTRAAELKSVVGRVRRPSPGEEFFETLCAPGCSADQALVLVRSGDRRGLNELARLLLPSAGGPAAAAASPEPGSGRRPGRLRRRAGRAREGVDRALRETAVSVYPVLWRRAGLGVVPRVLDVAEAAGVDATVLALRRRTARCEVVLLAPDEQRDALTIVLRAHHYVPLSGSWHRLTATGVERVRLVTAEQLGLSTESVRLLRRSSRPMAGRTHCRRATVETSPRAS
jgi:hypothetical protein